MIEQVPVEFRETCVLPRMAQAFPPACGVSDPGAMPLSCGDVPEVPDAARALDLDNLSEHKEARLAPGQRPHRTWPGTLRIPALQPAGTPDQSMLVAKTDQVPMPTGNPTKPGARVLPAAPPSSASDGVANNLDRQPGPSLSKKRRTGLTKADWKTMDYQDTESEE